MQIAVLPLNAGPNSRPALARQLSNFACEIARNVTGKEIHAVNYLAQFPDDQGVTRFAMVNPSETLNDPEMVAQFFQQAQMEKLVDGLVAENEGGGGTVTVRVFQNGATDPATQRDFAFLPGGVFGPARGFVEFLVSQLDASMPDSLREDEDLFGTNDPTAFEEFMVGFDGLQYIEKSQGMVANEFDPAQAIGSLKSAWEKDTDWEAPFIALLNLCRLCTQHRIGDAHLIEATLKEMTEKEPDDARAWFALGDFYGSVGNAQGTIDNMEKAIVKLQMRAAKLRKEAEAARTAGNPDEAAELEQQATAAANDEAPILARLGIAQVQMQMPANAERNLRRAVDLEGDDKPSLGLLSQVLSQTGRAHEVPALWKDMVDKFPQNPQFQVNYAGSLMQAGREAEAMRVLDTAVESVEDATMVKRVYAGILAQKGELDRAMDYFEDVIEVAPEDVQVKLEYAQTLQNANRSFEVPPVLRDVLNKEIDPNTRAQTQAWLLRLEQPKRVEAVEAGAKKLEEGDPQGALRELKPLKTWMSDFWELWMHLANAHNQVGEYKEAEEALSHLLGMFPGCEPAYAMLAASLHGQDRDEDAYNFLRNGLAQNTGSLTLALNFAQACMWTGRDDEGKAIIGQIREAMQGNEEVMKILDSIERQQDFSDIV
ncbi:MAG: tetratricopeptide repeat protein [Armatimonadetes bacterium]|nr:tetratricopeptide repeat protein [Armatimonadota bacterium]